MKTIVIGDIHNRIGSVEMILSKESHDRVVFLGDYFDNFGDSASSARRTAIWLKNSLKNPKRIHLMGNHDLSYRYSARHLLCSGYTDVKDQAIWEVLDLDDFEKLRSFYFVGSVLCTHAGLCPHFLPPLWTEKDINREKLMAWLDDQSKQFESYARSHQGHWFATVGDKRTDSKRGNEHGGIFWCDLSEFVPVEGLSQIFGHSCRKFPTIIGQNGDLDIFSSEICLNRPLKVEDHFSICIDTNNQHYAIIEDGEITLKPICSN